MNDEAAGPERDAASESARRPAPTPPGEARAADRWPWSWLGWLFRDRRTGRITVAQFPNVPLWIFLVTVALRAVVPTATAARTVINVIGLIALSWWALDEVLRGANPWRRMLGLGGCALAAAGLASHLR